MILYLCITLNQGRYPDDKKTFQRVFLISHVLNIKYLLKYLNRSLYVSKRQYNYALIKIRLSLCALMLISNYF